MSNLYATIIMLVDRLDGAVVTGCDVIPGSCPVPYFGDPTTTRVATLGINPSNREFVDKSGKELEGESRRFPTLDSLGIKAWSDADARHLGLILNMCLSYFRVNPYDAWFRRLDEVISGINVSYYDPMYSAGHLDLVPFATVHKWSQLPVRQRSFLLSLGGEALGRTLRDSPIRVLVLNGRSVVNEFQSLTGTCLEATVMPSWSLGRQSGRDVIGISYKGHTDAIGDMKLGREILVLGYNHNIQSSFGVTAEVVHGIRDWIAQTMEDLQW